MELIFAPFALFAGFPFLAIVPAILFFRLWWKARGRAGSPVILLFGVLPWLSYTAYEAAMWSWSRSVIAPIRVDLLLVAPALYLLTAVAVFAAWPRAR